MKMGILCVTYRGDADFWRYCHAAIEKFARGFEGVVLAVPEDDFEVFHNYASAKVSVRYYREPKGKGMLNHEAKVCSADQLVPECWDLVLHLDPDCIFTERVTPEDYLCDGKPILWRELYSSFQDRNPVRYGWRQCVVDALGIDPPYETMVRHPAVHFRWLYREFREAVEHNTGRPFLDYVLSCRNEFPQTFAEFPALGAFAFHRHPEAYHWVDEHLSDLQPCGWYVPNPGEKLRFFWSHGGFTETIKREIESILK